MKEDRAYLLHIRDSIARIRHYTSGGTARFLADTMIQDAVVRNLEIIGEAAKHVSEALKVNHAEVPWKQIAGMRDKVIHEYFGVNLELVWDAVQKDMPQLGRNIDAILQGLN